MTQAKDEEECDEFERIVIEPCLFSDTHKRDMLGERARGLISELVKANRKFVMVDVLPIGG